MLFELRLVPVAVADDDVAGTALLHAGGDRGENVGDRSRARQIDAGSAAGIVQVTVGEAGNDRLAAQIDGPGVRARERPNRGVGADGGKPSVADGNRLRDREARVD